MTLTTIALLGIAALVLIMLLGMPISYAMILTGTAGIAYMSTADAAYHLLASNLWGSFGSYSYTVIPMFILMGQVAYRSGITQRLYDTAHKWVGHYPGGIAGTTIVASMFFSAICGSNSATTATMATIALPEMRKYRYAPTLSTGSVAAGGTLGVMIPPSVALIIIAITTQMSVGRLFLAIIIPGVLLMSLFLLTVIFMCRRNPELGPPAPPAPVRERFVALGGVAETLLLFILVIGGLYAGWFTPTEAGAVGAFGAIVLGAARGGLSRQSLWQAVHESVRTTAMILLLLAGAVLFSRFLTMTRLPFELSQWAAELPLPRILILVMVLVIYLIAGMIMDALGFLVVSLPIFFPMLTVLGYDPLMLGVILVVVTTLGAITPPVGINVFLVSGLAPEVPIQDIFRGIVPFMLALAISTALLIAFPQLALFLPSIL